MIISDSIAIGLPLAGSQDVPRTAAAVRQVRANQRDVEVRLGVGPIRGALPARILGHAACVTEAIKSDLKNLLRRPRTVKIFSSAPKAVACDVPAAITSTALLAAALKLTGLEAEIQIDLANSELEVPRNLLPQLTADEAAWLQSAADRGRNGANPLDYAREHSAKSMFGDLDDETDMAMRVTIGAVPEATFWSIRTRVRGVAVAAGLAVTPAVALILKSCKVPWYSTCRMEPLLDVGTTVDEAAKRLEDAANPQHGGNPGLKREARAFSRMARSGSYERLVELSIALSLDIRSVRKMGINIGPNASAWLNQEVSK